MDKEREQLERFLQVRREGEPEEGKIKMKQKKQSCQAEGWLVVDKLEGIQRTGHHGIHIGLM